MYSMAGLLKVHSASWRQTAQAEAVRAGECVDSPFSHTLPGSLTSKYFDAARELLTSPGPWEVLPAETRTLHYQCLVFALLSRAACGVQANIHQPSQQYPFRLWGSIGKDGE